MKRLTALIVIVVLGITFLTSCARKPEKVKIGYQPFASNFLVFVAQEKGFFKAEGLDVELVQFQSANQGVDAVLTGRVATDFVVPSLVLCTLEDQKPGQLKVFLILTFPKEQPVGALLVKKDSEIQSPEELKGKKIGCFPGANQITMLKLMFRKLGYSEKDVIFVQMQPTVMLQSLDAGQIDALLAYEPTVTIAIEKGIARILVDAPIASYVINPYAGGGAPFSTEFVKKNPNIAKKIIKAINRAVDFINENPDEARKTIPKYTPMEEAISQKIRLLKYEKMNEINKAAVQKFADIFTEAGVLNKRIDTEELFLKDSDLK